MLHFKWDLIHFSAHNHITISLNVLLPLLTLRRKVIFLRRRSDHFQIVWALEPTWVSKAHQNKQQFGLQRIELYEYMQREIYVYLHFLETSESSASMFTHGRNHVNLLVNVCLHTTGAYCTPDGLVKTKLYSHVRAHTHVQVPCLPIFLNFFSPLMHEKECRNTWNNDQYVLCLLLLSLTRD